MAPQVELVELPEVGGLAPQNGVGKTIYSLRDEQRDEVGRRIVMLGGEEFTDDGENIAKRRRVAHVRNGPNNASA